MPKTGGEFLGKANLCSQCGAPLVGAKCGHCGVRFFGRKPETAKGEYFPSRDLLVDQVIFTALDEAASAYGIEVGYSVKLNPDHTSTLTVMVSNVEGEAIQTGWINGYGTGGVSPDNLHYVCRYYHPLQWGVYMAEENELWLSWADGAFDSAGETVFSARKTGYSSDEREKMFIGANKFLESKVIRQMVLCLLYPAVIKNEGLRKRLAIEIIGLR